jgi:PEP-CTERM motif
MRLSASILAILTLTLILPTAAHADVIDDFVLTNTNNTALTVTWSLPASPTAFPSVGAGGVVAGFFVSGTTPIILNNAPTGASLEFLSGQIFVGPGLILDSSLGNFTLEGPLLYNGTAADPTFNTGTFDLHDFYSSGDTYQLTITPETTVVPEPSTFLLLASGLSGIVGTMRRRR